MANKMLKCGDLVKILTGIAKIDKSKTGCYYGVIVERRPKSSLYRVYPYNVPGVEYPYWIGKHGVEALPPTK